MMEGRITQDQAHLAAARLDDYFDGFGEGATGFAAGIEELDEDDAGVGGAEGLRVVAYEGWGAELGGEGFDFGLR